MSKTVYIHIGHFKTGTTALQVFFKSNAALFAREGLLYPDFLQNRAKHSALAYSLYRAAGVKTLMHGYDSPDSPEKLWGGMLDHIRSAPQPAALISSEEFMRLGAHPEAEARLRQIIARAPDIEFRIIAYLRAPQVHIRSWYNQLVKMQLPVADYNTTLRSEMESIHLDFGAAIRPWANIFGAERVTIRAYDDSLRNGSALYHDFLAALKRPMPAGAEIPRSDPNPRMDDQMVEIVRLYHNAGFSKSAIVRGIDRAHGYFAAQQARLPADSPDIETIRNTARAGLEALRKLPYNCVDIDHFLTDLPVAEDEQSEIRVHQIGFLLNEIMHLQKRLRNVVPALERRVAELEKKQGRSTE